MANANVVKLTDQNFSDEALHAGTPVLVDFYAEWCGPCKMMAPYVDELATELAGTLKVGKLDVDYNNETAAKYGITGVPTLILFKDGKVLNQNIGALSKGALKSFVQRAFAG